MSNNNSFFFNSILMGIEPCDDFVSVEDKRTPWLQEQPWEEVQCREWILHAQWKEVLFQSAAQAVMWKPLLSQVGGAKNVFLFTWPIAPLPLPGFSLLVLTLKRETATVKYTSYFCTLWALWGFDCILYYYFFYILLELLLTHSPPPNHPETTITLTAINQLSSKNTLFDCVTVRRCEDK